MDNLLIVKKIKEEKEKTTFLDIILRNKIKIIFFIFFLFFLIKILSIYFSSLKINSSEKIFFIKIGDNIENVSENLKKENLIQSKFWFKISFLFSNKNLVQAGIYKFEKKDSLYSLIKKIKKGIYFIEPVKITIPEGSTNLEIGDVIFKNFEKVKYNTQKYSSSIFLDDFSKENISKYLINNQGYLFPETYIFLPIVKIENIIKTLNLEWYKKIKDLFLSLANSQNKISKKEVKNQNQKRENKEDDFFKKIKIYNISYQEFKIEDIFNEKDFSINLNKRWILINDLGTTTLSLKDIFIMASFLEGEANNEKDMKIVAGILWKRYKLNYPLQIDAATSTYKHKGLTKNPINNPGLIAIKSALNPIKTNYLFYITGQDGINYYAEDYNSHLKNINKYLRNKK